ncbi:MAG: pilus assembly protein PilN [Bacteroidetes bacterium]|nr:pilus assembly protein PilN [Bacteroidota bacterium]
MLKINLLPIRQLKKRAKARNQLVGFFVVFLAILSILAFTGVVQTNNITSLNKQIKKLEKEKKSYKPTLVKIEKLKKDKAILETRIKVINKLKKDSSLTVRVLDEVANVIDNERMWLQSLAQQGGSLSLKGIALDNQTIAQFMNSLKASPFIKGVNLTNSSLKQVSNKNFKSFSLQCTVGFPTNEVKVTSTN